MKKRIVHPKGRLGILLPNLGLAATSFIAWIEALKKEAGLVANTRHGHLKNKTSEPIKTNSNAVPLAQVKSFVFGGWDVPSDTLLESGVHTKAVVPAAQHSVDTEPENMTIMNGVSVDDFLNFFKSPYTGKKATKFDFAKALMYDMEHFSEEKKCDRLLLFWCDAAEETPPFSEVHRTLKAFEDGLYDNHPDITPSMIYAYAALKLGVPFINVCADTGVVVPALLELAEQSGTPISSGIWRRSQSVIDMISGSFFQPTASVPDANQSKGDAASGAGVKTEAAFLDLILFTDLAQRAGESGMQEWLSFYFETAPAISPNATMQKWMQLQNVLQRFRQEEDW